MIGPRGRIPHARWREKLSPPRALLELSGALYGPPRAPGSSAFLAWIFGEDRDAALAAAVQRAREDMAPSLYAGGPPGNYLVSGVSADDAAWFLARGFDESPHHFDLLVNPRGARPDPRARLAEDVDAECAWIASTFGAHWADEARRAHAHDGLFVARLGDAAVGFVAAGGNNSDAGTFGPVGVAHSARGRGLGEALTRTALHALAAQGFDRVTVPWVAPALVPFYARIAEVTEETPRQLLRRRLSTGSA